MESYFTELHRGDSERVGMGEDEMGMMEGMKDQGSRRRIKYQSSVALCFSSGTNNRI